VQYADWMVSYELFSLGYPEQLEYPTETWAAQELRKGNVLFAASQYVDAQQSQILKARGNAIVDRAWRTLMAFDSRCCTRPLAIVLQQGYAETYFSSQNNNQTGLPLRPYTQATQPQLFRTQRALFRDAMKSPVTILSMLARAARPLPLYCIIRRSWLAAVVRRTVDSLR
jgi:hypothetical protein